MIDKVAAGLERYMDMVAFRQRLVASNIANAETPNYHAKDVDFTRELEGAMTGAQPQTVDAKGLVTKTDGNNVSLEREMRILSENALRFQIASNLMKSEIRGVRLAIQDGKTA